MNNDNFRRNLIEEMVDLSQLICMQKTIEDDIFEILKTETKDAIKISKASSSDKISNNKHCLFDLPAPIKLTARQNESMENNNSIKPTL